MNGGLPERGFMARNFNFRKRTQGIKPQIIHFGEEGPRVTRLNLANLVKEGVKVQGREILGQLGRKGVPTFKGLSQNYWEGVNSQGLKEFLGGPVLNFGPGVAKNLFRKGGRFLERIGF